MRDYLHAAIVTAAAIDGRVSHFEPSPDFPAAKLQRVLVATAPGPSQP